MNLGEVPRTNRNALLFARDLLPRDLLTVGYRPEILESVALQLDFTGSERRKLLDVALKA